MLALLGTQLNESVIFTHVDYYTDALLATINVQPIVELALLTVGQEL